MSLFQALMHKGIWFDYCNQFLWSYSYYKIIFKVKSIFNHLFDFRDFPFHYMEKFENLETLWIRETGIEVIPSDIKWSSALTSIQITDNFNLKSIESHAFRFDTFVQIGFRLIWILHFFAQGKPVVVPICKVYRFIPISP